MKTKFATHVTILDHRIQIDDQLDVFCALPCTWLSSSPIVIVLIDVPVESFE
jgi:hypothetical protein